MNRPLTTRRWTVIGHDPESDPDPDARFFRLDPFTGGLFIHGERDVTDLNGRPATRTECENLERAAAWEAEHVEDRLRDHFDGVPNKWVESLRLPDAIT